MISIRDYDNMDNDLIEFLPDIEKHIPVEYKADRNYREVIYLLKKREHDLGDPFLEEEKMEQ
jgi:hypothetical protein